MRLRVALIVVLALLGALAVRVATSGAATDGLRPAVSFLLPAG